MRYRLSITTRATSNHSTADCKGGSGRDDTCNTRLSEGQTQLPVVFVEFVDPRIGQHRERARDQKKLTTLRTPRIAEVVNDERAT